MKKVYFMLLCAASMALVGCNGKGGNDPKLPTDSVTVVGVKLAKKAFEQMNVAGAMKIMDLQKHTFVGIYDFIQADTTGTKVTRLYRQADTNTGKGYGTQEEIKICYTLGSPNVLTSVSYNYPMLPSSVNFLSNRGTYLINNACGSSTASIAGFSCPFVEGYVDAVKKSASEHDAFVTAVGQLTDTKNDHSFVGEYMDANGNIKLTLGGNYTAQTTKSETFATFYKLK